MASIDTIVQAMLPAEQAIGVKVGTDLAASADPTLRAAILAANAMTAVVIGVLIDQGVLRSNGQPLTLAVFNQALTAAQAQSFTPVPPPVVRQG